MSRVLAMIKAGRERGVDDSTLLAIIEAGEGAGAARSAGAERQARYRANKSARDVTCDVTSDGNNHKKEIPPTPPKEKTTSTSNEVENYQARGADFEKFWRAYPQRVGSNPKEPARKSFTAAVKRGVDPEEIISGALSYAAYRADDDPKFTKQAVTWLNQRCWIDDYSGHRPSARAGQGQPPKDSITAALAAHIRGMTNEPAIDQHNGPTLDLNRAGYSTGIAGPGG